MPTLKHSEHSNTLYCNFLLILIHSSKRKINIRRILSRFFLLSSLCTFSTPMLAAPGTELIDNRLAPCPDKPNCVSTETGELLPVGINRNDSEQAWLQLQSSITELGGNIEKSQTYYLWATFQTSVFKFTDDVEARLDRDAGVIHLRSASRTGYYDFNTNKNRLIKLIEIFSTRIYPERLKNTYE